MVPTASVPASADTDLVPARLRAHATANPGKTVAAFIDDDVQIAESWSFAELDRRARLIAAWLQQQGFGGKPVVLVYPTGLEFLGAFYGCLYAGAVAVPAALPRSHGTDRRLALIIADSGSVAVLTVAAQQALVARHLEATGAAGGIGVVASDALPDAGDEWTPVAWQPDALALLQYTSGSTRSPSGVMVRHGNLSANLQAIHEQMGSTPASVGISWLPLFHDMGLVAGVLEPTWTGYPVHLMAPASFIQSPLRWLRAFSRFGGTIGGGPNFAYQACVDAARAAGVDGLDLSRWDVAWTGAEPVRASTLAEFRAAFGGCGFREPSLRPSFGLAEATLLVTTTRIGEAPRELTVDDTELGSGRVRVAAPEGRSKRLVSCGLPARTTEVRIVDPETLAPVQADAVGEIWVRGASVGQGYWNKPEESSAVFQARTASGDGPYLRTGDLGFVQDGELFVTGRRKDVIVIRGMNRYPQDLERTIEVAHPALRHDAGAVFAIEDEHKVRLVAVQEVSRNAWRSLDAEAVFVAVRREVAREHQLALDRIVLLKPFGLPKTSSGKVQRAACRASLLDGTLPVLHEWQSVTRAAPIDFGGEPLAQPGVLERQLVDWLQQECGLDGLTWKTPLMDLGIDSLKGVELGNALSAAFDHTFPATLLIEHPTVEALAELIRTDVLKVKPAAAPAPVPAPAQDPVLSVAEIEQQIGALDDDDLDAMLEGSIAAVLEGGARR